MRETVEAYIDVDDVIPHIGRAALRGSKNPRRSAVALLQRDGCIVLVRRRRVVSTAALRRKLPDVYESWRGAED